MFTFGPLKILKLKTTIFTLLSNQGSTSIAKKRKFASRKIELYLLVRMFSVNRRLLQNFRQLSETEQKLCAYGRFPRQEVLWKSLYFMRYCFLVFVIVGTLNPYSSHQCAIKIV